VDLVVTMQGHPNNYGDKFCATVGISGVTLYRYAKPAKRAAT
jgi:hypothetical protein